MVRVCRVVLPTTEDQWAEAEEHITSMVVPAVMSATQPSEFEEKSHDCVRESTHTSPISMTPDQRSLTAEPAETQEGLWCPWPT